MTGFLTLLYKELLRFWKVGFQTVFAPMVSTLLYLMIFSHVLEAHVEAFPGVAYTVFLIPGLVMMAVLQNAFANSSSSLIQSKITGNLVFVLLSPLSYREIFFAYVLASVVRGLAVGLGVYLVTVGFFDMAVASFPWVFLFAFMGSALARRHGDYRRHLGGQVRSARSLPKLCHSAAHFFIRSILFASLVAAFLATVVSLESVFLYDRRFPLWFFQRLGYLTLYQSRDCSGVLCGGIMGDIADAEERLQNPALGKLWTSLAA